MENEELVNILKSKELSKEDRCIQIFNIIFDKHFNDRAFVYDNYYDKKAFNAILELAIDTTKTINRELGEKEVENNDDNIVCDGDILILAIDNDKPMKYLLTRTPEEYVINKTIRSADNKYQFARFITINTNEEVGLNIIGKRVGETVKFAYGNDKNEHTIKILERFETTESTKFSKLYIEADAETGKRLK